MSVPGCTSHFAQRRGSSGLVIYSIVTKITISSIRNLIQEVIHAFGIRIKVSWVDKNHQWCRIYLELVLNWGIPPSAPGLFSSIPYHASSYNFPSLISDMCSKIPQILPQHKPQRRIDREKFFVVGTFYFWTDTVHGRLYLMLISRFEGLGCRSHDANR